MREPSHRAVRLLLRWTVPVLAVLLIAGCSYLHRGRGKVDLFRKLSPPVAYELIRDNPEMLVIDLRTPQEYNGETGHIQRARNIPLDRLPYQLLEISAYRDETFLVYCRADSCGADGVANLRSSGFENVILMAGGIESWIRAGFKTVLPKAVAGRVTQAPVMPLKPGEKPRPTETPDVPLPPPPRKSLH
ncbi:MAG TPA: rhodanese-like domain-containing protein [Thermoanaerobaculia bacterium]|nr:rhodanese-like domain-containing protein [Thermoanaerobaculia bacterium]